MSWQKIIFLAVGAGLGFVVGFLFADTANRKEHEKLRAEVARLRQGELDSSKQPAAQSAGGEPNLPDLTDEQLRNAVARADANPADLALQRVAGQALHLYAVQKGNSSILPEAVRILRRVHESDPKDVDVLLRLANALYIMAGDGESGRMAEARTYLEKAAALRPKDADIRASIGLTYFHDRPSDARSAVREYRRALEVEPRSELTLQNLAAALMSTGNFDEAEKRVAELEGINSSNETLPDLRAQLARKRNAARGQN